MSIIYPLALEGGVEIQLSDANFDELQRVGEITLSADLRLRLGGIARSWALQLKGLQSPRPKQFRKRLTVIKDALDKACAALDLNRADASVWEHHLFIWAGNTGVEGASGFFEDTDELLDRMRRMIEVIARLEQVLPWDGGRKRPYDDERFFIALADVFERAGGVASAYWSEYPDKAPSSTRRIICSTRSGSSASRDVATTRRKGGGMADTPFRRFVQAFYKMLPIEPKRSLRAGVDEALRDAMQSRRSRRPGNLLV